MNSIFLIINILLLLYKSKSIHVSSSNSFENDNMVSEEDLFNHIYQNIKINLLELMSSMIQILIL